jgi:hypothetical protein
LPKLWISQTPEHGVAAVLTREGHPVFPAGHPFAKCNVASVPGTAVTYTPASGFVGLDTVTFEEIDVDGGHRSFRVVLTVQ